MQLKQFKREKIIRCIIKRIEEVAFGCSLFGVATADQLPRLRGAPCGIGALPRRDPTLTSSLLGHGATFPAKPALYYVCLRRSPASIRIGRRREDQSQDKEEKGESEAIAVNGYSVFLTGMVDVTGEAAVGTDCPYGKQMGTGVAMWPSMRTPPPINNSAVEEADSAECTGSWDSSAPAGADAAVPERDFDGKERAGGEDGEHSVTSHDERVGEEDLDDESIFTCDNCQQDFECLADLTEHRTNHCPAADPSPHLPPAPTLQAAQGRNSGPVNPQGVEERRSK
ncbi:hypothetical protein QTP70_013130, partial [Hemibagrus guttatus]